ncbi:MAG: hypothetical protein IJ170_08410 [Ruminococcus sp.]|nr:hypothetical protein [Ruminococcus sp.]
MDKMKIFEAINLIGEDLIEEASEEKAEDLSAVSDSEGAVTGVDIYRRKNLQRFGAAAAAFLLIIGLSAAGVFAVKNRRLSAPDDNIVESEIAVTTKADESSETTTAAQVIKSAAAVKTTAAPVTSAVQASSQTTVKVSDAVRQTSPPVIRQTAPANKTTALPYQTTIIQKNTSPVTETTPAGTEQPKQTRPTETATEPIMTTGRPVGWEEPVTTTKAEEKNYFGGTKTMTLEDVAELSKKGTDLTWADLSGFKGEEVGSGIMILKYDLEEDLWLIVGGLPDDGIYFADLTMDVYRRGIDIRTEDISEYLNG